MRLTCIRHGETALNLRGVFSGDGAEGLTEAQRNALARITFDAAAHDAVYSSPAARCRETAACLQLPSPIEDARLAERRFGIFEGLTADECRARYPTEFASFQRLDADYVIPDGESRAQHLARVRAWVRDVSHHERVLAVTHGGPIDFLYRLGTDGVVHGGKRVFAGPNAARSAFDVMWPRIWVVEHGIPLVAPAQDE